MVETPWQPLPTLACEITTDPNSNRPVIAGTRTICAELLAYIIKVTTPKK
ncbi:hypothetical protein BJP36_39030 [Moorena producens JHB]|uniref:Uncharacterized protein n=1 Tax=Moorena producens (strain JHB) TaxID=1454205 RepID=A0A9Q9SUU8_MOOP1|nr:hypothetical protein [Moorena producens]WAN70060.1 hypothetical protein BJP36_39030 [Moorena producens JHB]